MAENAAGAVVGKVTVTDPDAGDVQSFQVSDSRFEVVNGQLKLTDGVSLDYETEPSVNVTVTATDSGGHSIQQTFSSTSANVNEAPSVTSTDGSVENHIVNTSTAYNPVANATVGAYLYSNDSAGVAKPASSLLNGVDASNMTLSAATSVSVTFQKEAAGNHNMIGTYQYDDAGNVIAGSVKFVWLDATAGTEGKLGASLSKDFLGYSQSSTISLGTMPAGTHVGFFTVSNGASDSGNKTLLTNAAAGTSNQTDAMAAIASKLSIQVDASGNGHVFVGNSQMNGGVFFTHNKSWNTDFNAGSDIDHMASGVSSSLPGQLLIGVEDLSGGGDKDFNDVVFSVDLGTYNVNKMTQSSLQPTVDFSDVDSDTLAQAVIHTSGFQAGDALNVPPSGDFNVTVSQSGADFTITIVGKTGSRDARSVRGLRQLDLLLDQQQDRGRSPHRLYGDRQRRPHLNRLHRGYRRRQQLRDLELAARQRPEHARRRRRPAARQHQQPRRDQHGRRLRHRPPGQAGRVVRPQRGGQSVRMSRRSTPPATAPTRCRCRSTTC